MVGRDERGQAVPLALVVVALAILATAAIAELGGNVVDAGRARTAADAAALAGVEGGREASASGCRRERRGAGVVVEHS